MAKLSIGDGSARAVVGTATNDNAATGNVGQVITATVASGSAISLSNATGANITSISLTAGDWDVSGQVDFVMTGATSTLQQMGISLTTNTLPSQPGGSGLGTDPLRSSLLQTTTITGTMDLSAGPVRVSLSATTTVYLVAQVAFSAGTVTGYGTIRARRMR